jgi:DMSO reductase iron-sulfur subunit
MLDKTRIDALTVCPDEPDYAWLPDVPNPEHNQYGKSIRLIDDTDALAGKSLNINGDSSIGDNPNRYKQHGFYFNADHCISCHACESACSEKNNLSPHLAFRSVGYVEGGTYPDYHRLNISMACNHCDDPVCLKGCPTRAYTKFAEYGAVLQDPDICFGCGYCTWVCPYNAPQLDPVNGQVEKCNMCVDRLEAGLKPACVSSCLAGALDFGIIETTPENRDQLKTHLPGFPDPEITHPNIRFQQTKSIPREMTRTDVIPLRYERDDDSKPFKTRTSEKQTKKAWGLDKLRSREDPLVIFTLITQAVVGAFLLLMMMPVAGIATLSASTHPVVYPVFLVGLLAIESVALFLSTMHLGKPHRFYRAFNNLRYSPVSREVAGIAVFYNLLVLYTLLTIFPGALTTLTGAKAGNIIQAIGVVTVIAGVAALYFMHVIYRIKARPFWNHWQVLSSFFGNTLTLGAVFVGVYFSVLLHYQGQSYTSMLNMLALPMIAGMVLEGIGQTFHVRFLKRTGGEAAASHYQQCTTYGKTYRLRKIFMLSLPVIVAVLALVSPHGMIGLAAWFVLTILIVASALIGRMLFYVLVIPTTMPGAFFWGNKGFQEHAIETGMAKQPQTGVVDLKH